jgi:hypothetical protein
MATRFKNTLKYARWSINKKFVFYYPAQESLSWVYMPTINNVQ